MTIKYIEIIKNSPYYYQVDGSILEESFPINNKENHPILWKKWKENLPLYCEKEKIFLEMVQLEYENQWTFLQTINYYSSKLDNEILEIIKKNYQLVQELYEKEQQHDLIIPNLEYWRIIQQNRFLKEITPFFFFRIALQLYKDDWTATLSCFRNLKMGKIMFGFEKSSCFIKGTPIWTLHGIIPIEKVQVNDQVATHNGRFSNVIKLFKNNRGNRLLYHVYSVHGMIAIATEDHPFLVYSQEYNQIVWKQVCELSSNDYLMKSNLKNHNKTTTDYVFLKQYPNIKKFIQTFPKLSGTAMSRVLGNHGENENSCLKQIYNENPIYNDLLKLLTDTHIRIQLWKWVLNTNQYLFVKGWMDVFQTKTYFSTQEEAELVMMILTFYNYCMKLKKSRFCHKKWCLSFQTQKTILSPWSCSKQQNILFLQDKIFVRFLGKIKCSKNIHKKNPTVYTLMVDMDHSYSVNGYIVKNCMGLTPNTMIMKEDGIVPISELKKGTYILDQDMKKVLVHNIIKYPYDGMVVAINDCVHTVSTPLYKKDRTVSTMDEITTENIYSPSISYYYKPETDKEFSMCHLNFLLRYICDWDIKIENDWCQWFISKADKLWIIPLFQKLYSFQYDVSKNDVIRINKNALDMFIQTLTKNLLSIQINKLIYFSSYLDRYSNYLRMIPLCHSVYCFVKQEKFLTQTEYNGNIYDIEIQGDSFCTTQSVIQKKIKTSIENTNWNNISDLYIPNVFFQKPTIFLPTWKEILKSQLTKGQPSLIFIDSHKNECVSGDTRILTQSGVVSISSKKDEMVSIWNGSSFINVLIQQTGNEKRFLKILFSNGMCLTCTPYHKFFIKTLNEPHKINASEIKCGDQLMSFRLPSVSIEIPSSIRMTLDWIAKRCVFIEEQVVLFDKDIESLRDILLDLQFCGIKSNIFYNSFRNEYELRFNKSRWNLLNYQHLNNNTTSLDGDIVDDIIVYKIEESSSYQPSYCFHEPVSGIAVFEGIATGQCENIPNIQYIKGCIDLSKFLIENPSKQNLKKHHVQVYTTKDCGFSRLLQLEYDAIEQKDIFLYQDEWDIKRHVHALSSVPAVFLDNLYIGDFMDFWKHYLCPVINWEQLCSSIYSMCLILDDWIDKKKMFSSHRPLVMEIYGFHHILVKMRLSVDDPVTKQLNSFLLEKIYYTMLKASNDLSQKKGACLNSNKIISSLQYSNKFDELWNNISLYGIRNAISLHIMDRQEFNIISFFYHDLKKDIAFFHPLDKNILNEILYKNSIQKMNIPNSFKKIYQNQYEISTSNWFDLMIKRKIYSKDDGIFHLYITPTMDQETLSELQIKTWKEGFYKIKIHKNN